MLDGADEEVGAEAHNGDRRDHLGGDGPGGALGAVGPEREPGRDIPFGLSALPYGHYNVEDVSSEQHHGQEYLQQQRQRQYARRGGEDKAELEEQEIRDSGLPIGGDLTPRLPPSPVAQGGHPDDEEGQRREQERRTKDRADTYLACSGAARAKNQGADYRDQRDHGLRQRRADGREYAPHGPRPEVQPVAHDFHSVGEKDRSTEYRRQRQDQLDYRHGHSLRPEEQERARFVPAGNLTIPGR